MAERRMVWRKTDLPRWFGEAETQLGENKEQQLGAETKKLSLAEIAKKFEKKGKKKQELHRKEAETKKIEEKRAKNILGQAEDLRFNDFRRLLAKLGLECEIDKKKQIIGIYPTGRKNGWGPGHGNYLNNFRFRGDTVSFEERGLDEKVVCSMEVKKTDTGYRFFLNGEEQEDVDTKINEKNQGGIEKEKLLDAPKEAQELAQRGYGYELNKSKKIVAIYPEDEKTGWSSKGGYYDNFRFQGDTFSFNKKNDDGVAIEKFIIEKTPIGNYKLLFDNGEIDVLEFAKENLKTRALNLLALRSERDIQKDNVIFCSDKNNNKEKSYWRCVENDNGEYRYQILFDRDGKRETISSFDEEKKRNPDLTSNQYLDLLAYVLTTPEKWSAFMEQFMEYVHDSSDPNNPLAKGTKDNHGEYWQSPQETVQRTEKGKMLGDCDDYAFLAQDILLRQGKHAQVMYVPSHATCVYVERRANGNYDAFSVGTFGFDKNGEVHSFWQEERGYQDGKGYINIREAINSLMVKFDSKGLGIDDPEPYRITGDQVRLLFRTENGGQHRQYSRLDVFET